MPFQYDLESWVSPVSGYYWAEIKSLVIPRLCLRPFCRLSTRLETRAHFELLGWGT